MRPLAINGGPSAGQISIHAPLSRCDLLELECRRIFDISIHAPLSRCDSTAAVADHFFNNFNPRTSFEVRPAAQRTGCPLSGFQSTHLFRGATFGFGVFFHIFVISIHAPLSRCDGNSPNGYTWVGYFNPRTSFEVRHFATCLRGALQDFNPRTSFEVRPMALSISFISCKFQSTHLFRGATNLFKQLRLIVIISIHAPLSRCDANMPKKVTIEEIISIHAPLSRCDFR